MSQLSFSHITQQIRNTFFKSKPLSKAKTINTDVVLYPRKIKGKIVLTETKAATTTITTGLDMPVTPQYRPPRAPIVLCHGLYGFDKLGPDSLPLLQVQYWGGIETELARLGAKVIVTKVPSTGSIWDRAHTLHSILKSILEGKDVNFVAHSMGGLDCRYLITHIPDKPYNINSLTTISTPHRGSPVMDWFRDNVGVGMALANAIENSNSQVPSSLLSTNQQQLISDSLSKKPSSWALFSSEFAKIEPFMKQLIKLVDTEAYSNLSTDYCKNYFNPNTPNDPNVSYYSYGAKASFPSWSLLNFPSKWIKEKEGINDGLVSVESAKWGKYIKTLEADHWDLNGQRLRWKHTRLLEKPKFDTIDFYMELATHLYQQGH